jgi:hypothetical protein
VKGWGATRAVTNSEAAATAELQRRAAVREAVAQASKVVGMGRRIVCFLPFLTRSNGRIVRL